MDLKLQALAERERRRRLQLLVNVQESWKRDFKAFASQLDIISDTGVRLKLRPNAIQSVFEASRSGRDIVLKPRQVGLTTWELARDIWFFLTHPGARVVVVVQSATEQGPLRETSQKIRVMFSALRALGFPLDFRSETVSEWTLGDSSLRVIQAGASEAAAEKKGRSGTIHRLHITELAFFEFAESTLNAMLECVPAPETGSEIVFESTANGASGFFFEKYQSAKRGLGSFKPHFFKWTDRAEYQSPLDENEVIIPSTSREQSLFDNGASPEQIKWYRRKVEDKKQDLVDQEYPIDEETCWLIAGRAFFDLEKLGNLIAKSRKPLDIEEHGALHIYEQPEAGIKYVIAADPSEGVGGDPSGAIIRRRDNGNHVATLSGQFIPWDLAEILAKLGTRYNGATIAIERNNHGHAVIQAIKRIGYKHLYVHRDKKVGWLTNEVSRAQMLDALDAAIRRGDWTSADARVLGEMRVFVITDRGKAEAAKGAHDDLVISEAIVWSVMTTHQPQVHQTLPTLEPRVSFEERGLVDPF